MASHWAAERCLAAGQGCSFVLYHRLGSWAAASFTLSMGGLSLLLPSPNFKLRWFSLLASLLVVAQIVLGILTFRLELAMPAITVAHQLGAGLLMALIGAVLGRSLGATPLFSQITVTSKASHG